MKVERFDFRNFSDGVIIDPIVGTKIFVPSGSPNADQPPPPPPPVFSEEDMKSSERDGYKKGFLDGVQDGRKQAESEQATVDSHLVEMQEQFVQSVSPIFADYRKMVLQVQQDVPKIALAIARKIANEALDKNAEVVIGDIAMRCCETMIGEPELTITAHESMGDTLERKLKQMAARMPAATHIIIMRDPAMPHTDCRIEWKQGSMERITAKLWEQIETLVGNMGIIATRETTEDLNKLEAELPKPDETPSSKKE